MLCAPFHTCNVQRAPCHTCYVQRDILASFDARTDNATEASRRPACRAGVRQPGTAGRPARRGLAIDARLFRRRPQELGALLVATTAGYVASSFSSGRLLRRLNLGTVLAASCLLTASGLLGYAAASHWPVVLALGVVLGARRRRDRRRAEYVCRDALRRTDAELAARLLRRRCRVRTAHHDGGAPARFELAARVCDCRRGADCARDLLCGHVPRLAAQRRPGAAAVAAPRATMGATLRVPAAWLGMAVFIAYAGVEASIGAWTFTLLTEADRSAPSRPAFSRVSTGVASLPGGCSPQSPAASCRCAPCCAPRSGRVVARCCAGLG